jgi:hypothetical protein
VCGLAAAESIANRMVRADAAAQEFDMERTRAFQDLFFLRVRDLWMDIRTAAVRAHTRWQSLPATRVGEVFRVVLLGNSAAIFAVDPALVAERFTKTTGGRVEIVPLLIPSATIADQIVLARAAIALHPDMIVALIDQDGFQTEPGVASEFIRQLFDPATADVVGPTATIEHWLLEHSTLYRARTVLRAIAIDRLTRLLPISAEGEREAVHRAFDLIATAARSGDLVALDAAYRAIDYTPPARAHFRRDLGPNAPVFGTVDVLGHLIARSGAICVGVTLPFNPLMRAGDALGPRDERSSTTALDRRTGETVRRLQADGCAAFDRLDALPATEFIDFVHVNAAGMVRFSDDLAAILLAVLRNPPTLAR